MTRKQNLTAALVCFAIAVIAAVALVVSSTSCDGDQAAQNAGRVLQASKTTWLGLQDQAAEMRHAGSLTDAQWAAWVDIDAKYRASHNAAVQAYKIYLEARDRPAEQALAAALANLTGIIQHGGELIAAWKGGE